MEAYRRTAASAFALGALLFSPPPAWAQADFSIFNSPHLDHTSLITGVGYAHYNAWTSSSDEEPAATHTAPGVRGFFEINVIEHVLEIEASAAGFWDDHAQYVTMELLAKKSFEFERFNPYLGVGPSLSIDILEEGAETLAGATFAAGTYFWLTDHVGLDLDVAYTLVSRGAGTGQELVVSVGPAARF